MQPERLREKRVTSEIRRALVFVGVRRMADLLYIYLDQIMLDGGIQFGEKLREGHGSG
jgi:hypothetical protein